MKTFLSVIFLIFSVFILFSPQDGYAWQNFNQGCLTCHPTAAGTGLHTIPAHSSSACSICHPGGVPGQNVLSSACIVCHPRAGGTGLCPLINAPAHAGTKQTCLGCHPSCAPVVTTTTSPVVTTTTSPVVTTTTSPVVTTTTSPVVTTTTTASATNCITLDPNEVTVDGVLNKDVDINVTFTRTDLIDQGLTIADLEKLVVTTDAACLNYITVNSNSINYNIGNTEITATVPITVKGNAPNAQCKVVVTDPQGIATPPINCEATFTIKSTEQPCQILGIQPSFVRVGLGIIPRIRKITITLNVDLEAAGITGDDLSFGQLLGAQILNVQVSGNQIIATVLFWGTKPGTYNISLGQCGTIPFEIRRF
jgi:hypothetical protein